jgi:hypothetical protein
MGKGIPASSLGDLKMSLKFLVYPLRNAKGKLELKVSGL